MARKPQPPFEIGTRIGDWTVIAQEELPQYRGRSPTASRVRCVCGTEKIRTNSYLRAGGSRSCGCKRGHALAMSGVTHNKSRSSSYKLWQGIKQRLKFQAGYAGIKMHEPWVHDFEAFDAFIEALGPKPTPQHTLDRIDSAGDYEPGNLRWADKTTQSLNRRVAMTTNLLANSMVQAGQKYDMLTVLQVLIVQKHGRNWYGARVQCECGTIKLIYQKQLLSPKTKSCGCFKNRNLELGQKKPMAELITANGKTMSMSAWARELGVSIPVIWRRINRYGWDPARSVTEPLTLELIEVNGEKLSAAEWSKRSGVPARTITKRIKKGWDAARAVSEPMRPWGANREKLH